MRQKTAARLPLTILGVFAFLANIDVATAAPLHPTAPPIAAASDLAQQVAQAKVPALNGYRGYENRRPGYIKSANGYWYPARAFSNPGDYTGSIGRQLRLNDACDYGFTPTNGSSRCNY